jgi:hypothetical protein
MPCSIVAILRKNGQQFKGAAEMDRVASDSRAAFSLLVFNKCVAVQPHAKTSVFAFLRFFC